jgi:hypothetical protein
VIRVLKSKIKEMKSIIYKWFFCILCVLSVTEALVADPPANPPVVQGDNALRDPKSTYQNFLDAVKKADLNAALKCWDYKKEDSAAMNIAIGIWIAHRRLNQAVFKKFKAEQNLDILGGWMRSDLTDDAIRLTEMLLQNAKVESNGDIADIEMKWDDVDVNKDCFRFPERPTLRKFDGKWRMTVLADDEPLKDGTWGPLFRDAMIFVNEAADKINGDEFKTLMELRQFLDAKEKAMTTRYDTDSPK